MVMKKPKIFLAADHAGFELKEHVKKFLIGLGYDVDDKGAFRYDPEDDYPDFILKAAEKVSENKGSMGIIFGGSGQGEAIVANKVKGIRAAVYNSNNPEIARLSREHNDANIISIGARFVKNEDALKTVKLWLSSGFSSEPRHSRRIKKIGEIEKSLFK